MLREYETIYILRPDISDMDADRVTERVRGAIRSGDGRILEVRNWGKRRLAYEIGHNQKGIYIYWRYAGNNKCVAELERVLRMLEPVLRYLTVKLKDDVDPEMAIDIGDEAIPMRTAISRAESEEMEPEEPLESAATEDEKEERPSETTWDDDSDEEWTEEPDKGSQK
ncbi:MAG: 30S ribosomal protein S6 [Bradymonadales bacterium]|nr:30S ribosomal protein S6 [Bradymonadales bacterium]